MKERVTVEVAFMSPDECVRRIRAASDTEAAQMLAMLERDAEERGIEKTAQRLDAWRKAILAAGPGTVTMDALAHSIGIAANGVRALKAAAQRGRRSDGGT